MILYKRFVLLICCCLLMAGCWDSIEVEERGFVTGIAIDLANEKQAEREIDSESEQDQIKLTQQLLNPSSLGSIQSNNTNTTSKSFRNISLTGDTII